MRKNGNNLVRYRKMVTIARVSPGNSVHSLTHWKKVYSYGYSTFHGRRDSRLVARFIETSQAPAHDSCAPAFFPVNLEFSVDIGKNFL
jgi:hypothetical protein